MKFLVQTRWLSYAATIFLAALILGTITLAYLAAKPALEVVANVRTAEYLDAAAARAITDGAREQTLGRAYIFEPIPPVADAHAAAAERLASALREMIAHGSKADAVAARRIAKLQARYVLSTRKIFTAVDANDRAGALEIDRSVRLPLLRQIQSELESQATRHRETMIAGSDSLDAIQSRAIFLVTALSVLAIVFLLGFVLIIEMLRRNLIESYSIEIKRLHKAARTDPLTQIGNHRAFKEDVETAVLEAREANANLTVALFNLDAFKMVNHQHGHARGDAVLIAFAEILRDGRDADAAYRLGGDKFAVIMKATSLAEARPLLDRFRAQVLRPLIGQTVCIGYASTTDRTTTGETLESEADAALYASKRAGRNSATAFDRTKQGGFVISAERVKTLRSLIDGGTLDVAFQPIWDLDQAEILAFESLSRPNPAFGFESPQDAFDLAERIGCAHELDGAARRSALRRGRELPESAFLFLNVSPQTLDGNLDADQFLREAMAVGMRPDRIVIEITERAAAHMDNVVASANRLRKAGFRIALDDVGAGHAGLEIMSRMRFDFVKIDRMIIVDAMEDISAKGVIAAIVAFARITGSYVIAEGIEDRAMLDFIAKIGRMHDGARGIRGGQGYMLCRPGQEFPKAAQLVALRDLLRDHAAGFASPVVGSI